MASRWPQRFRLAAAINRSTSASVRNSRVRSLPLGSRLGVTVRFTVAGVTSLRCDLAMCFTLAALMTVRTITLYERSFPVTQRVAMFAVCEIAVCKWTNRQAVWLGAAAGKPTRASQRACRKAGHARNRHRTLSDRAPHSKFGFGYNSRCPPAPSSIDLSGVFDAQSPSRAAPYRLLLPSWVAKW